MNFFQFISQDWKVNKGNIKGRIILLLYRTANICSKKRIYYYLGIPYLIFYKILVEWFFSVEIPWRVQIGRNLTLYHGQALVLNDKVIIGENCTIRHSTTIGNKMLQDGSFSASPILGNNVDVGSNVCIIGDIYIKDNVKIGCGAVITKNVSGNCTVVGNPAIEKKKLQDNYSEVINGMLKSDK